MRNMQCTRRGKKSSDENPRKTQKPEWNSKLLTTNDAVQHRDCHTTFDVDDDDASGDGE